MTLVSIVGDFHSSVLPLFYQYSKDITNHVIVYDDHHRDKTQAKKIINGTEAFITKHKLPIVTHTFEIDEDSLSCVTKIVAKLEELQNDPKKLLINATDGLANIALLLSHNLLLQGVRFLTYDKYDNSYNILSQNSMFNVKIEDSIPILEHFRLKNVDVLAIQELSIAHDIEQDLIDLFELCNGDRALYERQSTKPHPMIIKTQTGFLYEMYIYNLLKELNHDDIQVGIKVNDYYSKSSSLLNEFDILIMKNNHLHMIECKYRDDIKKAELIYKADSIRNTLDDESKVIILTNEAIYDFQNDIEHITPRFEFQRANAKQIFFRGLPTKQIERFLRDIDSIFNLNTPDIESIIQKRTLVSI